MLGILTLVPVFTARYDQSPLGEHPACVESVAFDPSGRWLASSAGDGSVCFVTSTATCWALPQRPQGSEAKFGYGLAFAPDGSSLPAANSDGSVALWNVAFETHRRTFRLSTVSVRCVAYSPDTRLLATGSCENSIALCDLATMPGRAIMLRCLRQPNCVVFSPNGRALACATADATAQPLGRVVRREDPGADRVRKIGCTQS